MEHENTVCMFDTADMLWLRVHVVSLPAPANWKFQIIQISFIDSSNLAIPGRGAVPDVPEIGTLSGSSKISPCSKHTCSICRGDLIRQILVFKT